MAAPMPALAPVTTTTFSSTGQDAQLEAGDDNGAFRPLPLPSLLVTAAAAAMLLFLQISFGLEEKRESAPSLENRLENFTYCERC